MKAAQLARKGTRYTRKLKPGGSFKHTSKGASSRSRMMRIDGMNQVVLFQIGIMNRRLWKMVKTIFSVMVSSWFGFGD